MNILTFDIEDWFVINDSTWVHHSEWKNLPSRIEVNVRTILELLEKHDIKATFFILGWVAERFPHLIREIFDKGHEVGYHSFYHLRPFKQTQDEFEDDLVRGISLLEELTGRKVTQYRAPNLSVTNETSWIYPILARNGITMSSSTRSHILIKGTILRDTPVKIKTIDGNILEFPLNRLDLNFMKLAYSGSGFFRLCPACILKYLFNSHSYNMLYFHPRDFDPQVPSPWRLGPYRNWRQSVNSTTTLPKLDSLMQQTVFNTLSDAADTYQHMKLQEIDMVPKYPFRKVG